MTLSPKNIALFGTSANPPTIAHQKIICWLSEYYDLVAVWASNNPSKQQQVSLKVRIEMLDLLIKELDERISNVHLCTNISDRKTVNTVTKAKAIWSDAELTLVVGSDLAKQISKWYQIQKIFEQVKVLIVSRIGYELTTSDLENLKALGSRYEVAELLISEVSSSQYRETKDSKLLTPAIQKYLQQSQLY